MSLRARLASPRTRRAFLLGHDFPATLPGKLDEHLPGLSGEQRAEVLERLREWFLLCQVAGGTPSGMPSKAVDAAWHEFILMTREYTRFCEGAFGRYLHHTPEAQMRVPMEDALARTAAFARKAGLGAPGVPAIFSLDARLGLPGAQDWTPGTFVPLARQGARALGEKEGGGAGWMDSGDAGRRGGWAGGGCGSGDGGGGGGGGCGGGGCGGG
jgi:hypothetical protein